MKKTKIASTKAELLKRNGELLDQKLALEHDLKWAKESRERWINGTSDLESRFNKVVDAIKKLRARALKKTLSAELDAIIELAEGQ